MAVLANSRIMGSYLICSSMPPITGLSFSLFSWSFDLRGPDSPPQFKSMLEYFSKESGSSSETIFKVRRSLPLFPVPTSASISPSLRVSKVVSASPCHCRRDPCFYLQCVFPGLPFVCTREAFGNSMRLWYLTPRDNHVVKKPCCPQNNTFPCKQHYLY